MENPKRKINFPNLSDNIKLEILSFIEPDQCIMIMCSLYKAKNFKEIFPLYIQRIFINTSALDNVMKKDPSQIFHIFKKEVLPIYAFYSDGGYRLDFIGTDSFHDEKPNVYLNNLFNIRQASYYMREDNNNNVNILAGLPYSFSSTRYYKIMKFFKEANNVDALNIIYIIEKYKKIYSKLIKILNENGLKFNDFLMIFFNLQDYEISYYPKVDFEISELLRIFEEDSLLPKDVVDFFQNLPNYRLGKFPENSLQISFENVYLDCAKSNLVFLLRELCIVNNKGCNRIALYISDEGENFNLKEEFRNQLKLNDFTFKNTICEIKNERPKDIIQFAAGVKTNYIEFNLRKFGQKIKPLLIIETMSDFEFEKIVFKQYFLGKYLVVKKINNNDCLEFTIDENDKFIKIPDYEMDFVYSWEEPSLPKLLLYGSLYNM